MHASVKAPCSVRLEMSWRGQLLAQPQRQGNLNLWQDNDQWAAGIYYGRYLNFLEVGGLCCYFCQGWKWKSHRQVRWKKIGMWGFARFRTYAGFCTQLPQLPPKTNDKDGKNRGYPRHGLILKLFNLMVTAWITWYPIEPLHPWLSESLNKLLEKMHGTYEYLTMGGSDSFTVMPKGRIFLQVLRLHCAAEEYKWSRESVVGSAQKANMTLFLGNL